MLDQPRLSRRAVLCGALAVALGRRASAGDPPPPPIVDTHQHLWDLRQFDLAWLANDAQLHRDYLMADYLAATAGLNVTRAIYMEVAVPAEQRAREAEQVLALCDRHEGPTVAAVIGGDPGDESFRPYVDRFKRDPQVKGVRCWLPGDASQNRRFVDNVRYLGDAGWRFELLPDPAKLADAARLVAACPRTRFVLDHCGNATTAFYADDAERSRRTAWEEGIAALADQKNVICKISGVCEAGPKELASAEHAAPVVDRCLDRFGADRVVFAGNWPVCLKAVTLKGWVEMLRQLTASRGEAFGRKLFHDNAMSFYELT